MIDHILTTTFLIGLIIASLQDLRRREVDNWLNLSLLLISISYVLFSDLSTIRSLAFSLIIMFLVAHLFYYGRIFAGGDAKLLFATSALFVNATYFTTLSSIGVFLLFLMMAGSLYGFGWSFMLYTKNYKAVNKKIFGDTNKIWFKYIIFTTLLLVTLLYVNKLFVIPALVILLFPLLYVFAKGLEDISMMKEVPVNRLRPGDWLGKDLTVGTTTIKAHWEGLTAKDIELLQKTGQKKKVIIKEGMPFVPAFFLAFVLYVYAQDLVKAVFYSLV